jgi:hypothetical protein
MSLFELFESDRQVDNKNERMNEQVSKEVADIIYMGYKKDGIFSYIDNKYRIANFHGNRELYFMQATETYTVSYQHFALVNFITA